MEANRAKNMLVHETEIMSRPAKQWFQNRAAKLAAKGSPLVCFHAVSDNHHLVVSSEKGLAERVGEEVLQSRKRKREEQEARKEEKKKRVCGCGEQAACRQLTCRAEEEESS